MTKNCVTLDSTGSVLRYGNSDFENDGSFDGDNETYHSDVGSRVSGIELMYNKISIGVCVEMTTEEKTAVDDSMPKRNMIMTYIARGTKEILNSNGAISPLLFSTRLTKGSEQAMTLADGTVDGLFKAIRSNSSTPATITCSLDQDIGAYVSFSVNASSHVDLIWYDNEGYWDVVHYKNITWNT